MDEAKKNKEVIVELVQDEMAIKKLLNFEMESLLDVQILAWETVLMIQHQQHLKLLWSWLLL